MKYLKIDADAVFWALAALRSAYHEEKIRVECGQSWPERADYIKGQYDMFKVAVEAAEIIEEGKDETV